MNVIVINDSDESKPDSSHYCWWVWVLHKIIYMRMALIGVVLGIFVNSVFPLASGSTERAYIPMYTTTTCEEVHKYKQYVAVSKIIGVWMSRDFNFEMQACTTLLQFWSLKTFVKCVWTSSSWSHPQSKPSSVSDMSKPLPKFLQRTCLKTICCTPYQSDPLI